MANGYKKFFVLTLFCLLFLPMTYMVGVKDTSIIYGSESVSELPSIQDKSFAERKFQPEFERWWNTHFAFRKFMLKSKNQIYDWANFGLIHKGYFDNIIEGKHRYLFGKYLFKSVSKNCLPTPNFEKLEKLQNYAQRHGIKIYFVLAPSKALTYYDYLPMRYKYFLGKCPVHEQLASGIKDLGIPVYNSQPLMEKLREEGEYQPFPIGGIHWNYYGAGKTLQESAKYFKWAPVKWLGVESSPTPYFAEQDLTKLQNLFFTKRNDKTFYKPTMLATHRWYDKTIVIGDSYSNEYNYMLCNSGFSDNGMVAHYGNKPLNDTDIQNILSAKRIIFVYTDDIIDSNHQFWKKLDALANVIEKTKK